RRRPGAGLVPAGPAARARDGVGRRGHRIRPCPPAPTGVAGQANDPLRRPRRRREAEAAARDRLPRAADRPVLRTGGQLLVGQLELIGVDTAFCVPGESYLALLDALHDSPIRLYSCRHEAAAANMAEAYGKLTGRPGICLVTRGPGATHASTGVHTANQDSTPMILLVGQVPRRLLGREAFQELDYPSVFGGLAKWAAQIDDGDRIPEYVARA